MPPAKWLISLGFSIGPPARPPPARRRRVHGDILSRATELGEHLHRRLGELVGNGVAEVRGRGLWAGVQLAPGQGAGRAVSQELARRGVLVKETQQTTLRFAPPIVITADEIDWAVDELVQALAEVHD